MAVMPETISDRVVPHLLQLGCEALLTKLECLLSPVPAAGAGAGAAGGGGAARTGTR